MENLNDSNTFNDRKIAFIGTGLMGEAMAHRLLDAGFELTVYNRTVSKTDALRRKGATVAKTPRAALQQVDIVIQMLNDYTAIQDVFFNPQDPDAHIDSWQNKTFILMNTVTPDESRLIGRQIEDAGGEYLEAPVMGSIPHVKAGDLKILVAGTEEQFQRWDGLLAIFGKQRHFIGETGQAAALKLALNQLAFSQTAMLAMSLGFLRQSDVDIQKFLGILRESALYWPGLERKYKVFMDRDYSFLRFPMKVMRKDLDLMIRQFTGKGIDTAPLDGLMQVLEKGIENGLEQTDGLSVYDIFHPPGK
jgi:3-hydroxyisobutyrate dehydrogenase